MDFDLALRRHLGAVQERDLTTLRATLHPDVRVLLPSGELLEGRDAVMRLHESWFSQDGWSLSYRVLSRVVLTHLASVVLAIHLDDIDSAGKPLVMEYFLGLCFARSGDDWLLVHDQNSVIH